MPPKPEESGATEGWQPLCAMCLVSGRATEVAVAVLDGWTVCATCATQVERDHHGVPNVKARIRREHEDEERQQRAVERRRRSRVPQRSWAGQLPGGPSAE